jgi:2-polyprenyl-6-hydroxyphenyl methylase/3-demethylubiquinone-9 3-methyltransferase
MPHHPPQKSSIAYVNEEAARQSGERLTFSFGANWQRFVVEVDEGVIQAAVESFRNFTKLDRLDGQTFLDFGCGSGLSSLVAVRLGADRVVSVDVDPNSLAATKGLRSREDVPETVWVIQEGSVLDRDSLSALGRHSYVYSWGVLHHTGAMWDGLANVAESVVEEGGRLHISLYNRHRSSETWLRIKRACNRWPQTFRPAFKGVYVSLIFGKMVLRGRWPGTFLKKYTLRRGMSYFRDVDDWLGGLPYEYCTPEETIEFLAPRGYALEQLRRTDSPGVNEFLFVKTVPKPRNG